MRRYKIRRKTGVMPSNTVVREGRQLEETSEIRDPSPESDVASRAVTRR